MWVKSNEYQLEKECQDQGSRVSVFAVSVLASCHENGSG